MDLLGQVLNLDSEDSQATGVMSLIVWTESQSGRETYRQKERDRQIDEQTNRGLEEQTNIQTIKQRDTQTERNRRIDKQTDLGFSKDDVDVRCRALEDIWSADDKQDALGLSDGYPGHTVDRLQTQLRHGLTSTQKQEEEGQ